MSLQSPRGARVLEVDIFSDFVCPWCFIAARRLDAAIELSGLKEAVIRYHPYVLHDSAPPEGIDLGGMLEQKYGLAPKAIFERVESAALESGIPLDFSRQPRTYSTVAAHTLMRFAESAGRQRELADALFIAYFLEARNISDSEVLREVGATKGLVPEEIDGVLADPKELEITRLAVREAADLGVRGVPLMIFNRSLVLSGAQSAEVFRDAIARALEAEPAVPTP